jgi:FAD-dependent urate hydroxylase
MSQQQYEVIVIGAGIAGLSLAIALTSAGHRVRIFERQEEVRPLGAGLILWSNAVNALCAMGLRDAVADIGQPLARLAILDPRGRALSQTDARAISERAGGMTVAVHRADLLDTLMSRLPADVLRTKHELSGFQESEGIITARFANGSSESGDLLIGADGIWSAVRTQIHGNHHPRYSGYTAWRSISPNPDVERFDVESSTETWGRGIRFGWVPLTQERVYWFAVKNAPEHQEPDTGGHRAELLELFGSWHSPVPETIEAASNETILRHDIYDRPPISNWGTGAVTLAGDAAHPITPNTGQGAAQAIEDALVLTDCLRRYRTIEGALRSYESIRAPRTRMISELSRRIGRMAQVENRAIVAARDLITWLTPDRVGARQIEDVVSWQAPMIGEHTP